jgi:alpha-L-rhamnosidase
MEYEVATTNAVRDGVVVTGLRTEHQQEPLGIDERAPRLGWRLESGTRGVRQTAYRILVGTDLAGLDSNSGLVWDSGRVDSDESIEIAYAGAPLESRLRYYWTVRSWAGDLESEWAEPTWWEMGLLEAADWSARWIRPEQRPAQPNPTEGVDMADLGDLLRRPVPYDLLNPAQYVRRSFSLGQPVRRARVYASAHGVYTMELNGARVGDRELAPEWTAYQGYLMYQVYDVTDQLIVGSNAIGMVIADGWYAGRLAITGASVNHGDTLEAILQLEVEYEDGSVETIASDGTFVSSTGPVVYGDLLIGEKYDARLEVRGWSRGEFVDSGWRAVTVTDESLENLVANYGEPIKVIAEFPGVRAWVNDVGEQLIDFGQNVAGRTRMRVSGPAGTTVSLAHTETLDADGHFFSNIMGGNADATDVYVLKGEGVEEFEPSFTYRGFRYVKLSGYPGSPVAADFTAVAMSSDSELTMEFESSDPDLNQLQSNIMWTIRDNMFTVPTDNPDRERGGWTGDFEAIAPNVMMNLGLDSFTTRWMRNMRVDQLPDGQVPMVIPYFKGYRDTFSLLGADSGSAWAEVCIIAPWVTYSIYGDARILEENYESGQKWLGFSSNAAAESRSEEDNADPDLAHLWRDTRFGFGDWLVPSITTLESHGLYALTSGSTMLIPTLYWARATDLMSRIATVLGKPGDAAMYSKLNEDIKTSFRKAYLAADGVLADNTQGMYVLALEFDMVPPAQRQALFDRLVELIGKNGGLIDTGFLSTALVLPLLSRYGRTDLAYQLLFNEERPSWLYQVRRGATTIWEMWDSIAESGEVSRTSQIQPGLSTVGVWLYETVGGVAAAAPGYKEILIHPQPHERLTHASTRFLSVYGQVSCAWRRDGDRMTVDVTIPANTTARVQLDGAQLGELVESGRPVVEARLEATASSGSVVVSVGSGTYRFEYARA